MLACASNLQDQASIAHVERLVEKTSGQLERTYEFFFNLCQVQMKQQLYSEAFRSLVRSYQLAAEQDEDTLHTDATRFKIQELHALNTFCHEFSAIEYNIGGAQKTGPRFNLPRSLKHDNLIEVNMSALAQEHSYDQIDREHFKEVLGNLNWNKFAERISQQLASNQNLTSE